MHHSVQSEAPVRRRSLSYKRLGLCGYGCDTQTERYRQHSSGGRHPAGVVKPGACAPALEKYVQYYSTLWTITPHTASHCLAPRSLGASLWCNIYIIHYLFHIVLFTGSTEFLTVVLYLFIFPHLNLVCVFISLLQYLLYFWKVFL